MEAPRLQAMLLLIFLLTTRALQSCFVLAGGYKQGVLTLDNKLYHESSEVRGIVYLQVGAKEAG